MNLRIISFLMAAFYLVLTAKATEIQPFTSDSGNYTTPIRPNSYITGKLSFKERMKLRQKRDTENVVRTLFDESMSEFNADSILRRFDDLPAFNIFKDNYFVAGTDVFGKHNSNTSDAKFQISIGHRLTDSRLPFRTYLFLTYSQIAIWDVFKKSFPFRDINYNPGIGLGKALIYNNKVLGALLFQFEHESNGRSEEESRSWNKISLTNELYFNRNWQWYGKVWIPLVDGENNRDLARYKGWGDFGMNYLSNNGKYRVGILVNKRATWDLGANLTLNFSVRFFDDENQHLFVEYYNGYGENLLDYKTYRNRLRVGFVISSSELRRQVLRGKR